MYVCAMKNVKPKNLMPKFYSAKQNLLKYLLLIPFLSVLQNSYSAPPAKKKQIAKLNTREIIVDFSKEKGALCKTPLECIGAGRANEGLRADWQQQLAYVKNACDFKYIRMHGCCPTIWVFTVKIKKETLNITFSTLMLYTTIC